MSGIEDRIQAFVKLGDFFRGYVSYSNNNEAGKTKAAARFSKMDEVLGRAKSRNGWFTHESVLNALDGWANLLNEDSLKSWLAGYDMSSNNPKEVAIITAGNIPLVGFHDLLSTLITGNRAVVKCSSNDNILLPYIVDQLIEMEPSFKEKIQFIEGFLENFDAVIATGSNNTARYFEYYFGKKPHIIRKNRNSVAVLSGRESSQQLELLGEDVFRYYGLGCRSVSKIFVPRRYDFDLLFKALFKYKDILEQVKYANNYEYNKAVYLMSEFKILDNGFMMLREDPGYASPIATLFYEYYDSKEALQKRLDQDCDLIQCIVSRGFTASEIPFGQTQNPGLKDYADGLDTVEFLLRT